jgi:hypothetical protein
MNEKNWWEINQSKEDVSTSPQDSTIIKEKDKKNTLVRFLPMLWWGPIIFYFIILIVKDSFF